MTLPDGWLTKPLADVAQVVMGQSPDSKYYSVEEVGLPFLQGCAEFQARHPKHAVYCSHSKKIGCAGSILLSVRAPVGRLNVANRDYVIGRGLAALNGTGVTQDFLEHFMVFQEPRFRLASQGSTFEAINSSELKQWPILHPKDKAEQAKIAEVLSTVDRAIEQTEALIAKQERIKTGLMQDLLTRGIDEHGNLRSERTHEFRDSPLGRIPVEWECASFGDCWGESPQNGLYKPQSQYSDNGTPIVRIDGFRNGDLIDHQKFRRVRLAPAESRTFALEAGDLLVNRVNSIEWLGKAAHVGSLTETTVFESNMMRIRVDQKWLISEFAILVLSSPHAYHHFRLCAKTAIAQASINQEDARSLLVALPHRVEQHRIVDAVQAAHRADGRLKVATLKLRLLRTGLMQDLLTGNRRVTPLLEQCEGVTT